MHLIRLLLQVVRLHIMVNVLLRDKYGQVFRMGR